jgi:hypothetical protein
MNELDALRQMRTALAQEESPDRLALRTGWRSEVRERPRRRLKVPLLSVAAATAVAVVALRPDGREAPAAPTLGHRHGNVLLAAATNDPAEGEPSAAPGRQWQAALAEGAGHAGPVQPSGRPRLVPGVRDRRVDRRESPELTPHA